MYKNGTFIYFVNQQQSLVVFLLKKLIMKKFVLLFIINYLSISTTLSQGWVQTMDGYANEIDCGSPA